MRKGIIVIVFMMLLTGCGFYKNVDATTVLNYLEGKYERDFEVIFYEDSDYLSTTKSIHCYTDGMNKDEEYVEVFIENDRIIGDNYFGYYIRPEVENYIGNIVGKEFEEYKVYRANDFEKFPNELTCNSTLDNLYNSKDDYWIDVKVYVRGNPYTSEEQYEESIRRIEKDLLDSNHRYTINIFILSDNTYETIGRYEQDDFTRFYAVNREPDRENYYYVYRATIVDGEIL